MKNAHISLTEFTNESRVLKEIDSLKSMGIFNEFIVLSLGSDKLPSFEKISEYCYLNRIQLRSKKLPSKSFFQFFKLIEFMIRCFSIIKKSKISVINVHTLALIPLAVFLKFTLRIKIVYDAHELETEKNGLRGLRKWLSKVVERTFIGYFDLVVVVSDSIADWYSDVYNITRPLVVKNTPKLRERKKFNLFRGVFNISESQIIMLYQGGLVSGRGIELILETFKLRQDSRFVVVFMGYGELQDEIISCANNYDNIFYLPAVSPDTVLDYTSSADIGISLIENTCLSYFYCLPNKLFEYAMAGLPVIVSNMKEMSKLVSEFNLGLIIEDFTPEYLNFVITNLNRRDISIWSDNAYRFASSNSWETQEHSMLVGYRQALLDD